MQARYSTRASTVTTIHWSSTSKQRVMMRRAQIEKKNFLIGTKSRKTRKQQATIPKTNPNSSRPEQVGSLRDIPFNRIHIPERRRESSSSTDTFSLTKLHNRSDDRFSGKTTFRWYRNIIVYQPSSLFSRTSVGYNQVIDQNILDERTRESNEG